MKKLNKSLLAAAIIGAVALPGVSSAGTLTLGAAQRTVARDLFNTDAAVVADVSDIILTATGTEITDLSTEISAGNYLDVRLVLPSAVDDPGFDVVPTAQLITLIDGFSVGTQGNPSVALLSSNPVRFPTRSFQSFTNINAGAAQQIGFRLDTSAGAVGGGGYFLKFDGLRIGRLLKALGQTNGAVPLTVEVYSSSGALLTSGSTTILRSAWGLTDISSTLTSGKTIDVGSSPNRRTRYAPTGVIGESNPASTATNVFEAGVVTLDITKVGGSNVRHLSSATASYNVIAPSTTYTVEVEGQNLSPWGSGGPDIWLGTSGNACALPDVNRRDLVVSTSDTTKAISAPIPQSHPFFSPLSASAPAAGGFEVCFGADSTTELFEQPSLSGRIVINYNNSSVRRTNNPDVTFDLEPLLMNGETVYFQNVNPGGNPVALSFLRLTSHEATDCPVFIDAKNNAGEYKGPLEINLKAHSSEELNSEILEAGTDSRFVSGTGWGPLTGSKWYVRVTFECNNATASALNRNRRSGTVTDLTSQSPTTGSQWSTP